MTILYSYFKFIFIEFNPDINIAFVVAVLNSSIYCKLEIS